MDKEDKQEYFNMFLLRKNSRNPYRYRNFKGAIPLPKSKINKEEFRIDHKKDRHSDKWVVYLFICGKRIKVDTFFSKYEAEIYVNRLYDILHHKSIHEYITDKKYLVENREVFECEKPLVTLEMFQNPDAMYD